MNNLALKNFLRGAETVGFFGIGRSNLAIMRQIPKDVKIILRSECRIRRESIPKGIKPFAVYEGDAAFSGFEEEVLFLSPSVRRERREFDAARTLGIRFASDLDLFLSDNQTKLFAVTGSDGKSTTATLTADLLSERFGTLTPIGNIGIPFCEVRNRKQSDASVAELSSFQLRYTEVRADRAAVTNLTPNHLNWHSDFEEYKKTKLSLLESSYESVISADNAHLAAYGAEKRVFAVTSVSAELEALKENFQAELYLTVKEGYILKNGEPILPLSRLAKREDHNIKNFLTALALTDGYVSLDHIAKVAGEFKGLPHRCETVLVQDGIRFINSSIDTSPSRTATTLCSLGENIIAILGGRGKGCGYTDLQEPLKKHAKLAILTGENRYEIADDIKGCVQRVIIDDFEDAVLYAVSIAASGDTVLLSPASTSYDAFESFEKRGDFFKAKISDYYKSKKN